MKLCEVSLVLAAAVDAPVGPHDANLVEVHGSRGSASKGAMKPANQMGMIVDESAVFPYHSARATVRPEGLQQELSLHSNLCGC